MPLDAGPTAAAHWDAFWPILQDIRTQLGGTNADLKGLQVQCDNGNENLGRFADLRLRRVVRRGSSPLDPRDAVLFRESNAS